MHVTGAVEDGKAANEEFGICASSGVGLRGNIKLAAMDPTMGPADGFF